MIYIVRHGETDFNAQNRFQGSSDIELNDTGIGQARVAAEKLQDIKFDAVYSSPLMRARKTCEIILSQNKHGGEIIFDDRIRERDFGDYERLCVEDVLRGNDYAMGSWWNESNEMPMPNGESIRDVETRVHDFINYIKSRYKKDENVLVVCHGGVARVVYYMHNEKPADGKLGAYFMPNAEIAKY